jgi:hypothetical protein
MKFYFYPTVGFGTKYNLFFTKIMNIEVCEVLTKLNLQWLKFKSGLIKMRSWIYTTNDKKIQKIITLRMPILNPLQQTLPNKKG